MQFSKLGFLLIKEGGSGTNPCSETHAGARAFSEVESLALSQFLSSIQSGLVFYLSVHSYGHYILIPCGHTNVTISEYDEFLFYRIGSAVARSIAQRYNTQFRTGNVLDLSHVASGESFDWVRGVLNLYLALGIELRDQGRYGFVLPADQIIPSGEEFVDGLVTLLAEVKAGTQNKTSSPDPRPARMRAEVKASPDFASFGHYRHPRKPLSPLSSFQRD